jgi:hypothetical protein
MDPSLYSIGAAEDPAEANRQAQMMAASLRRQGAYATLGGTSPINAVRQQSPGLMKDAWQREDRLSEMPRQRLTQSVMQQQADKMKQEQADMNSPATAAMYQEFIRGMDPGMAEAAKGVPNRSLPLAAGLAEKKWATTEQGKWRALQAQQAAAAKAGQTPPLNPKALDQAAHQFAMVGDFSKMGNRALSVYAPQIMNRAAEMYPDLDIASGKASGVANQKALTNMVAMSSSVEAFERSADKGMAQLEGIMKTIPNSGTQVFNRPLRALAMATGDPAMAAFHAAIVPIRAEAARIITTANLQGQLSDAARKEMESAIGDNATPEQIHEVFKVLRNDFSNRKTSNNQQIAEIKARFSPPQQGAPGPAGAPPAPPSNLAQKYGL